MLTLEGETLEGGAPTAGETTALALAFARARSLIRLRRDFVPEVARSADDL